MATLTISHYLYLSRDQRYKLHAGEIIEIIGISVPVWFYKGTTSEPAQELFCKYKITNEKVIRPIVPIKGGFHINLPQKTDVEKENNIPQEVQDIVSAQLGTSDRLLDIKDGGVEWLEFRQYNKIQKDGQKFNVIHFVEIKPNELLADTIS